MITVNGETQELGAGSMTVAELLDALRAPAGGRGLAVALDGEVVPRAAWAETMVRDGSRVEILGAVQGG